LPALTQALPSLTAGRTNDLGDVFLSDVGYTATASGRAVRADDLTPISGATVRLSGLVATTDANGSFRFVGPSQLLPVNLGGTGVVVGMIRATGLEDKPIVIDPPLGASPPDNALGDIPVSPPVGGTPGGPSNIRGTITITGQSNHSGVTVTLIDRGTSLPVATRVTEADGRYGFWVVAGDYTVRAEKAGLTPKQQDVTLVRPDVPVTVDLTLAP
jgi:hypothetical protein